MNKHYIFIFLISGFIISGISYLGNLYNPITASILSAIPIAIPSILLINSRYKQKIFIKGIMHMNLILIICNCFCYYLINQLDYQTHYSVGLALLLWLILSIVYYIYSVRLLT